MAQKIYNLYSVLGVHPSADAAEIRRKYRQAALRSHPDKGGSPEAFHLLTLAFEVLSCPASRAQHDRMHLRNTSTTKAFKILQRKRAAPPPSQRPHRKRPASSSTTAEPPSKKPCKDSNSKLQERMARIGTPLTQLRTILQCMQVDHRRSALQTLPPRVQAALVVFAESVKTAPAAQPPTCSESTSSSTQSTRSMPTIKSKATSGITAQKPTVRHKNTLVYKAHVHIKALRFYTSGCNNSLEMALDRQMVLVQMRQALLSASVKHQSLLEDPDATYAVITKLFQEIGTSEEELGLSAYIYLRAGRWLVQTCTIISPVMPLFEAIKLHAQILRARRTSWQDLRTVWVKIMQSTRQHFGKRKSLRQAEAIADAARASALKMQLGKAVKQVEKALDLEELRTQRARKKTAKQQVAQARREAKAKRAAALAEQQALKMKLDAWKERLQWKRVSHLTMDDIMYGPQGTSTVDAL